MSSSNYSLSSPPESARDRELWLQHAAGFILFQDVRQYALDQIDESADEATQQSVKQGIDDALYGLMMVLDGVTGGLSNDNGRVQLKTTAQYVALDESGDSTTAFEIDLAEGDGMCMGFHGWRESDFGSNPVVDHD